MFDYKLIEALAMVVDKGGFERAAKELLITQSAVSQRVRALEDQLGTPLVIRTTPPTTTAVGTRILSHYRKTKLLEHDLLSDLELSTEGGFLTLPLGINEDSMAFWFIEAITPLAHELNLMFNVTVDDQDETHKLLKNGEVLGCVSSRSEPLQGCSVAYLGRMDYFCLATSDFAERWFPDGLTAEALKCAPAVVYSKSDRAHERFLVEFQGVTDPVYPHHLIPSSHGFYDAIKTGLGYAMVQRQHAEEFLSSGAVIDLYPQGRLPIHLYWHHWDLDAGPIKELTDALVSFARKIFPQHDEQAAG
jgi:LysR family transcriptional regulator (chromosome initiation inhibitor)